MPTLSTERRSLIMDYAIKLLGEFLAREGEHFTDGWQAYDAKTDINIWLDQDNDNVRVYNVTAYDYNTANQSLVTNNWVRVGSIIINRKDSK